jgi:hypothetical protein
MKKYLLLVLIFSAGCVPAGCDVNATKTAKAQSEQSEQSELSHPRFTRVDLSRISDSTCVDILKDTVTETCYAVYTNRNGIGFSPTFVATVPCL